MSEQDDIFRGVGIEVELTDPTDFLKVKETLTRIGIASRRDKTLLQSVHVLHKRGRYVILHFKELFYLDGKPTTMTDDDYARRNRIADLLDQWGLLKVIERDKLVDLAPMNQIKIVPFKEKEQWVLMPKYTIGGVVRQD